MAWEAWVVPAWEYPRVPAEVNFQSLLVPTVDSIRALAIIHHLQVGGSLREGSSFSRRRIAKIVCDTQSVLANAEF